jgi:predicted O-linked N-acetylglucosamine transferase (SPINDLY family)
MLMQFIRRLLARPRGGPVAERSHAVQSATGNADPIAALHADLAEQPDDIEARCRLAGLLQAAGRDRDALEAFEQALKIDSKHVVAVCAAAALAAHLNAHDRAIALYRSAVTLVPDQAAAILCNQGASHAALVQMPQAMACYEEAIRIQPTLAEAHYNLGCLLKDVGRIDEAEQAVRRAVELRPDFHQAHSTLLCIYGLHRNHDQARLLEEHKRWSAQHASGFAPLATRESIDPSPDRRLTIGYVSGDFCEHSVSFFIEPVLARHDHERFRIICYDNWSGDDAVNRRLRRYADEWRRISHLNDDDAAALIRNDKVDILVDLSGHTVGNRMLVFARRPAPIQATWFGYMCTTGLATMDYRITDAYFDPPGFTEQNYSETLVRIDSVVAFSPAPDSPAVNAPPSQASGVVTFGSFNNYAKIGDEVVAAWVRILNAVPTSRLVLVALGGDDPIVRTAIEERFIRLGLERAAVQLAVRGRTALPGFLAALQEVDIALDPFPYSGGTTSLHTLWMGVPIIAIEGDSELSRSTSAMLRGAGADALIASTVDHYCELAIALAGDAAELARWRASLRQRMAASPMLSGEAVTRSLEGAYRDMWKAWRNGFPAGTT